MRSRSVLRLGLLATIVAACDVPADRKNPVTGTHTYVVQEGDVALEMHSFSDGSWERMAIVHGYWDDLDACLEIVALMNENLPREYRCKAMD